MTGRDHPLSSAARSRMQPPGRRRTGLVHGVSAAALIVLMGLPAGSPPRAQDAAVTAPDPAPSQAVAPAGAADANPDDVAALLPLLMTSPERKRFASDLESSIRLGNLEAAEHRLKAAIETGTLAIVLADKLRDPGLLTALQALGIKGADDPPAAPDTDAAGNPAVCTMAAASAPNAADLQEALEREQARGDAMAWELATLTEEFRNLQKLGETGSASSDAQMGELQQALQRERERGDRAERELASAREEYGALQALHERDATSQAGASAQIKEALAQERERSESTARELAAMQEELSRLKNDREAEATSMNAQVAELREALKREGERSDTAAHELAAARKAADDLRALREQEAAAEAARLTELTEALARERQRRDAVTQELASAIDELRTFQEAHGSGPAPLLVRLASTGVPSPQAAPPEEALPPPDKPVFVAAAIAAPPPAPAPNAASDATGTTQAMLTPPPAVQPPRTEAAPPPAVADDRLLKRANSLLRSGDVSAARLLLERSAEEGNAQAVYLLAETFDPHVLAVIGALGIRSDAAKAQELYARALALGIRQAEARMRALK
ncbi:hypothetical protein ACFOYU_26500 [Microvirga sp. GCM10011540]|uniref:hypothetical protein n=1 Tax=Microvirga sp. GCM10011540 TaxID=3317338 RepID=UPI00361F100E